MKANEDKKKGLKMSLIIFGVVIVLSYASGNVGFGTLAVLILLLNLLNRFWLKKRIQNFQEITCRVYRKNTVDCLHGVFIVHGQ